MEADKFKTASTLGVQAIVFTPKARYFLEIYMTCLRPIAAKAAGVFMTSPRSPMFLDINGRQIKDIGRYVTAFFVKTTGLHITISILRSVIKIIS